MKDGIRFSPAAKASLDATRLDDTKQGYLRALMAKARGVLKPGSRTTRGATYAPSRVDRRARGRGLRQAPVGPGIHGRMAHQRKAPASFTLAQPPMTHATRKRLSR